MNIMAKDIYDGLQVNKDLIFTTSTKTQYAGPDAHIAIIKFLKHISAKYLKDFMLNDEGNYWENGDENILLNKFKKYNAAIDSFCDAMEGLPAVPGDRPESLAVRIERLLNEKLEDGNKTL
jgi:hypothetical protein